MPPGRQELTRAEAAQHSYLLQPRAQARAEITHATVALRISLRVIEQHAALEDAAFARQAAASLERYRAAIGRLLAAVAAGDTARAQGLEAREVQSAFVALAEQLAEGAQDEQDQVTASLAALRR